MQVCMLACVCVCAPMCVCVCVCPSVCSVYLYELCPVICCVDVGVVVMVFSWSAAECGV